MKIALNFPRSSEVVHKSGDQNDQQFSAEKLTFDQIDQKLTAEKIAEEEATRSWNQPLYPSSLALAKASSASVVRPSSAPMHI